MSLRWRLTLLYTAATSLIFAAAVLAAALAFHRGAVRAADRILSAAFEEASEIVEAARPTAQAEFRARLQAFSDGNQGLFLALRGPRGEALYDSDPEFWASVVAAPRGVADGRVSRRTVRLSRGGRFRVSSVVFASGLQLEMASPLPLSGLLLTGREALLLYSALALLIAAFGWTGWYISGRALAPIERITRVARNVSRGALDERIAQDGSQDELGRLIEDLNRMLARIEASAARLQQFMSNVSHQLKTPLTILRGQLDVALEGKPSAAEMREVLESSVVEIEKLSALVTDLLSYARMENESFAAPASQPLEPLVREVARKAQVLARTKEQTIELELESASAVVQPIRLEQALLNVIENSIKNTPPGGRIRLSLRRESGRLALSIEDSGPGVPPEELPRLFERGHSRSGTGIGLGLARALTQSFGGKLEVSCAPGQGLSVRILLPG